MERYYLMAIGVMLALFARDSSVSDGSQAQYDFTALDAQLKSERTVYQDNLKVAINRGDEFLYQFPAGELDIDTVFDMALATKWISGAVMFNSGVTTVFFPARPCW